MLADCLVTARAGADFPRPSAAVVVHPAALRAETGFTSLFGATFPATFRRPDQ